MKALIGAVFVAGFVVGCANTTTTTTPPAGRTLGWQTSLGQGKATSYAELDSQGTPRAIGLVWSAGALDGLPQGPDRHRCHGRTKEGHIDGETKCQHTVEQAIPLPDSVARRAD